MIALTHLSHANRLRTQPHSTANEAHIARLTCPHCRLTSLSTPSCFVALQGKSSKAGKAAAAKTEPKPAQAKAAKAATAAAPSQPKAAKSKPAAAPSTTSSTTGQPSDAPKQKAAKPAAATATSTTTSATAPSIKKKKVVKSVNQKFTIDCSEPASDEIFDIASFEKFLQDRIKVGGKVGVLGDVVSVGRDGNIVNVSSKTHYSKRYFKYLTKKFLKKQMLRDYIRVISKGKQGYFLRYFNFNQGGEEEAEE